MNTTAFLALEAPLARYPGLPACVSLQATLPIIPYSSAHGLILGLCGIDTRALPVPAWPVLELAIGTPRLLARPRPGELLHQLHVETVGASGEAGRARAQGTKPWIRVGRRQVLTDFAALVAVRAPEEILACLAAGLQGKVPSTSAPWAGDSNFGFDRLELVHDQPPVHWYAPPEAGQVPRGSCRLPIWIDRADNATSTERLVAPLRVPAMEPPPSAWVAVPAPAPAGLSA